MRRVLDLNNETKPKRLHGLLTKQSMKHILFALVLCFAAGNCSTFYALERGEETQTAVPAPDRTDGCKRLDGLQRQQCINALLGTLENFQNSSITDDVLEKSRGSFPSGMFFMDYTREICVMHEDERLRCWKYNKSVYDPHIAVSIAVDTLFFALGVYTGIQVPH